MTGYLDFKGVNSTDETPLPKLYIEWLCQFPQKSKQTHETVHSVGEIEKTTYKERNMIDTGIFQLFILYLLIE